jgi:hypothetical protein
VILKDRQLSEDTTVGAVFMDSVKEDKQLRRKTKNIPRVAKDNSRLPV